MILIDSLYINESGGLVLLKYLIDSLENSKGIQPHYLLDERVESEFKYLPKERKTILFANQINRYNFYKNCEAKFDKIFCFGNVPPIKKNSATVYTYFHNIYLLSELRDITFKNKLLIAAKTKYIKFLKNNTDFWIVQTDNTKNALIKKYVEKESKVLILPFYKIESIKLDIKCIRNDYIYVAIYQKPKNHFKLIKAWSLLYDLGYSLTLHLTLPKMPEELTKQIDDCISRGMKIVNHGFVSKTELGKLYSISKVTIYPSINESLGLGIIEALNSDCDLIGADLPYTHSISNPSAVFNPFDIDSIVSSVILYESGTCPKSKLKICNEIDKLLSLFR